MNFNARVTLAVNKFFRKYKKVIITVVIIWGIVLLVNYYLKSLPKSISLKNTYTPDIAVITSNSAPSRYQQTIKDTVKTYIDYCNAKNYELAYDMLTDNCKEYLYANDITYFKSYVDSIFTSTKIYNLQNYSNTNKKYIYDITILDDIGATGTTGDYNTYTEKLTLTTDDNGSTFKISNNGYIDNEAINISNEDNYMKMKIISKDISYKKEAYNVEIKNKTDSYLIISDNTVESEVTLSLDSDSDKRTATNLSNADIILNPGETANYVFIFNKYYDDGKTSQSISLNTVRLLTNYNGSSDNTVSEASKVFSFNIKLE